MKIIVFLPSSQYDCEYETERRPQSLLLLYHGKDSSIKDVQKLVLLPRKTFFLQSKVKLYTTMSVVGVEHVLGNWSVQFVGNQLSLASGNLEQKL